MQRDCGADAVGETQCDEAWNCVDVLSRKCSGKNAGAGRLRFVAERRAFVIARARVFLRDPNLRLS
jgi:hypothetical protein